MPVHIPEGNYATAAEAAKILSINPTRVWQLIKEGKLPSIQGNGFRLIPLEAIDERNARLRPKLAGEGSTDEGA